MTTSPLPDARDLNHFNDETEGSVLDLPIGGKTYTFLYTNKLTIRAGKKITQLRARMVALAKKKDVSPEELFLAAVEQQALYPDLIGADNEAQMEADGVTIEERELVGDTLVLWHLLGREAAEKRWRGDDLPPAKARKAGSASTKTAGSSRTTSNRKGPAGQTSSSGGGSSKPRSNPSTKST